MIENPVKRPKVPPIRPRAASVVTLKNAFKMEYTGINIEFLPSFPFQFRQKLRCPKRSSPAEECCMAVLFLKLYH